MTRSDLYYEHAYEFATRNIYECAQCHKQISITPDTLFHGTLITLVKWFWAIYFLGSDKGSISALKLSKLIDVAFSDLAIEKI